MARTAGSENTRQIEALDRASYDAIVYQGETLHGLQRLFKASLNSPYVRVRRDNDLVAANFPALNIDLQSPAFVWPETVPAGFGKGIESPTTMATFNSFIESILDRNDWISRCDIKQISEEGNRITCLALSQRVPANKNGDHKLRVWLQGGVHGNEPAGDQSLLALIGKMDADPTWTARVLAKMDIWLIPRYNVDGIEDFRRTCLLDLDLNRDYIKVTAQQSRDMRKFFHLVTPHIAIDMHEFGAAAKFENYVHGSDVMLSAAKNLNVHPDIRQLSEDVFIAGIGRALKRARLRWSPYVLGTGNEVSFNEAGGAASIGRNAMGLTQCVSILCEIRGIGIADQHFHRRTLSGLKCLESVLQIAMENADCIRATLQRGAHDFVHSWDDIVIQEMPSLVSRTFPMVDTNTGKLTDLTVPFKSTSPLMATMTRARPAAYLIPASMVHIADRLVEMGLHVKILTEKFSGDVEVLTIVKAEFEEAYHEGVVPMSVVAKTSRLTIHLPAGTRSVSTRQKNAALAFIALEPENADSYVRLNVIPVTAGEEYPIYRLMAPPRTPIYVAKHQMNGDCARTEAEA